MDLYVIRSGEKIIAVGAVERVADCALFRSLAVSEDHRGKGIGSNMTSFLIHEALNANTREIFLLTETAESFFHGLDFSWH